MDFSDYAWTTSFQVTKKKHEDVKILVRDDVAFPFLGKDEHGYVICLPEPKRISKSIVGFQGLSLNLDYKFHRMVLWQLFRASVFHLSQHAATSGFESYINWAKDKDQNLALFVTSMIEDAIVAAYTKTVWSPFMPDVALANTIAYLRIKPIDVMFDDSLRIMAAILSQFTVGRIKGILSRKMQDDTDVAILCVLDVEDFVSKQLAEKETSNPLGKWGEINKRKLEAADKIYSSLHKYGKAHTMVSMPHTESYSGDSIYQRNIGAREDKFSNILKLAFARLDSDVFIDEGWEREANQAFSVWEARQEHERKILESYRELLASTRFSAIEFPKEDYAEYLRSKQLLSSPIRRVLEKLRVLKNVTGEDFKYESGFVDLQEAIQIVASQSRRTDIFVREELQTREEAWAIVIDASRSMSFFAGEARGIALCLAETARNLILDRAAWGMFAFSDKFYVIKDFSENYSTRIRARIGGLSHSGLTYIPDGLAIVKNKLRQRIEQAKIIMVVSDFFPSGDAEMGNELSQNLKQIERAGFGLIGIGLRSRAVRDYFRINCVVDTPYDLMKKFAKAFLEYSSTV